MRGLVGNSLLWGAAWFTGATVVLGLLLTAGVLPTSSWSWEIIFEWSRRVGLIGVGAGAAFSTALPLLFRGRALDEISLSRFVLGGAALAGLTLLGVVEFFVFGSIRPSPFLFAGIASVFGAATAATTLTVAKRADRLEVQDALARLESEQTHVDRLLEPEAV